MTWFAADDKLHAHFKAHGAGLLGMGLWVMAGSWCADKRTDGAIPRSKALALCGGDEDALTEAAAALVRVDLWEVTECGWQFHDWSDYQPTAHELGFRDSSRHEKKVESGRKGGLARASNAKQTQAEPSTPKHEQAEPSTAKRIKPPVPARPVPEEKRERDRIQPSAGQPPGPLAYTCPEQDREEPEPEKPAKRVHRATSCPADTDDQADLEAWCRQHRIQSDHEQLGPFLDWHRANGRTSKSWPASWRNWLRKAEEFKRRDGPRGRPNHRQPAAAERPAWQPQDGSQAAALLEAADPMPVGEDPWELAGP